MSEVLEKINEVLYEYENYVGSDAVLSKYRKDHDKDSGTRGKIAEKLYWALIAAQGELVCAEKGNCKCENKCKGEN